MDKVELFIFFLWLTIAFTAIIGAARAMNAAEAELEIKAKIVFKCGADIIPVDECVGMTHTDCCAAYGLNQIEPSAGMEATPLEPIDYQSEWLEQGQNLE